MSDEEALEIATAAWKRIIDGNMAYGRRIIADAIRFHVNKAIDDTYATSARIVASERSP
jgi:hypothetical protein